MLQVMTHAPPCPGGRSRRARRRSARRPGNRASAPAACSDPGSSACRAALISSAMNGLPLRRLAELAEADAVGVAPRPASCSRRSCPSAPACCRSPIRKPKNCSGVWTAAGCAGRSPAAWREQQGGSYASIEYVFRLRNRRHVRSGRGRERPLVLARRASAARSASPAPARPSRPPCSGSFSSSA